MIINLYYIKTFAQRLGVFIFLELVTPFYKHFVKL